MRNLFLTMIALAAFASPAMAGRFVTVPITTASLANGSIDTIVVNLDGIARIPQDSGVTMNFVMANLETAAADSASLGIDIGTALDTFATDGALGSGAWQAISTIGLATAKLDPKSLLNFASATYQAPLLRLRVKNVSGGTEIFTLRLIYYAE